jgi:hypothetical protein
MAGQGLAEGIDYSNTVVSSLTPGWSQTGQLGHQSCVHTDISKLVEALTLAQSEFSPLLKDTENPYFKSKYADLAAVIKATLPALNKYGLTVIQLTGTDFVNKAGIVTTILAHKSGQQISSTLSVPTGAKFDAQSLGSALTYGKRYAYQAIIGVAADIDDDGNSIATGFTEDKPKLKYEPKPGKPKQYEPVNKEVFKKYIEEKSPESGQFKPPVASGIPKASLPPAPKINVNTNAGFASVTDHEPTKEEKDEFKKKARLYIQTLLPEVGIENPADAMKAFVEKLTGQTDTKKLSYLQWCATLEALDNAVIAGNLKAVVEG